MSFWATVEPWIKGAVSPLVGYALGLATPPASTAWRKIRRKPDLRLYIEQDPSVIFADAPENWISAPTFVPRPFEELPAGNPTTNYALREWAMDLGGIPADTHEIELTLTAWQKLDVVIDAMIVDVREFPVPDGVVLAYAVGGAAIERRRLNVQLATFAPAVRQVHPHNQSGSEAFSFKLSGGETAKIHVSATAASWADSQQSGYEWTANLLLLVDNKQQT